MEFLLKVLVCVVGVLLITGDHGDASIDSIVLMKTTPLLEDNIKSEDAKLCYRPCKINVKPKRCHFHLVVAPSVTDDGRVTLAANDTVPGPAIHVCANDIVVAEVTNKIPDQDLTMHWHGSPQRGTPYMDGVPMITQCPVGFGATYKYAFRASVAGTYFYHASSVTHQADGVFGALIVSQPAPMEPHASLFEYDRSKEHTLLLAASFPELLTANLKDLSLIKPTALTINGLKDTFKLSVSEGFGYRLRLINAVPVECSIVVSVDSHQLVVIATDGHPVAPTSAARVLLYPGERMDVVLRADQPTGGYWLRARGRGACGGLQGTSAVLYSGYNYTGMIAADVLPSLQDSRIGLQEAVVSGQSLTSLSESGPMSVQRQVYLGIDRNLVQFRDTDNDFRYISDAIPKKPFFPSQLTTRGGAAIQINGKSFLYPSAPLLTQARDVPGSLQCRVGEEPGHQEPQCLLILEEKHNTPVELILVNEGRGSNDSYTFHLHGYSAQVLATWTSPDQRPLTAQRVRAWDGEGKVHRNLANPPLKDTITVPNKGFTIVRVVLDNRGVWLLECGACGLGSLPTAMVLSVPETIPKSVSAALPKCGSFRPPDVLLN